MKNSDPFRRLVKIMHELLSEKGCPWDREQTHKSLKPFLIEEAYEVIQAIDDNDFDALKEELGDLLLQIVFHSEMASVEGKFNIDDVLECICEKMIARHPHVFSDSSCKDATEVLRNWEELKKNEKRKNHEHVSILDGIPKKLPSLLKAHRIQDRAARVGFDWNKVQDVMKKIDEEVAELHNAIDRGKKNYIEDEFGDILFALVNLSRFLDVQPEDCLQSSIRKFAKRFKYIEQRASQMGKSLKNMTLEEMDKIWEESKIKLV
jgi:tetrapyrrole methylase family protein/MazG family protein